VVLFYGYKSEKFDLDLPHFQMSFLRRNNNLQFVCIPNPPIPGVDGPATMLIKVKNAEAATDLETHINNRLSDGN
jgi:hypothetical protein